MRTRQETGRQRQQVFAVFVAMIVVGAVGCSSVNDALNQSDRNSFITSANSFTKAYTAMGAAASANVADESKFPAAAQPSIDAMKHQLTEMNRLARKVTGKARTIAAKAAAAATNLVGVANGLVVATTAHDEAGITGAIADGTKAEDEFNTQIRAWNQL